MKNTRLRSASSVNTVFTFAINEFIALLLCRYCTTCFFNCCFRTS
jgi:hypothetical protein